MRRRSIRGCSRRRVPSGPARRPRSARRPSLHPPSRWRKCARRRACRPGRRCAPRRTLRAENACGSPATHHRRQCACWPAASGTGAADNHARHALRWRRDRAVRRVARCPRTRCGCAPDPFHRAPAAGVRPGREAATRARPSASRPLRGQSAHRLPTVGPLTPCVRRDRSGSRSACRNRCAPRRARGSVPLRLHPTRVPGHLP